MKYNDSDRQQIFDHTNGRCHYCKEKLEFKDYGKKNKPGSWEVDHIIPKAMGGPDYIYNLAPVHPWCNKEKTDKLLNMQSLIFNPARTDLRGSKFGN